MSAKPLYESRGTPRSLRSPAIVITAAHRESLVKPVHIMIPSQATYNMFPPQETNSPGRFDDPLNHASCGQPPSHYVPEADNPTSPFYSLEPKYKQGRTPSRRQDGGQAKPKAHSPQPSGTSGDKKSDPFDEWTVKFGVETVKDTDACCLAFWVPCAQYGKTHWRLKQVEEGKDPSNASWKPSYGCNGPCWAWYGMCFLSQCDCIMTGLQRARIRATYGIKGKVINDLALSLFCRPCVMVQMDREVRAREGDHDLRMNSKAPHITAQPAPVQGMRYLSPRQTASSNGELNPQNSGGETEQRGGLPGSRRLPYVRALQSRTEKDRPPPQTDEYHLELRKAKPRDPTLPKPEAEKASGRNWSSTLNDAESSKSNKALNEDESNATKRSDPALNPSFAINKNAFKSMPTSTTTQGLEKSSSEGPLEVPPKVTDSKTLSQQQATTSFSSIKAENPDTPSHMPAKHTNVGFANVGASSSEHTIVWGSPVINSSMATKNEATSATGTTDLSELSYVHDFTDCPVDKTVLEYYEKEEIRSQLPGLFHSSQMNSANHRQLNSSHKHANLADSAEVESISVDHIPADDTEMNACNQDKLIKDKSTGSEQHALADCTREGAGSKKNSTKDKSTGLQQHALENCTKDDTSSLAPSTTILEQHTLANCHEDAGTSGTPVRQSRRPSTPAVSPTNKDPKVRLHRLASCPVPSRDENSDKSIVTQHTSKSSRYNESGDSQSTLKPAGQHALSECSGDANSEQQAAAVDGEGPSEKPFSLVWAVNTPVKDQDVADNPTKELELSANFIGMKFTSQIQNSAHNALSQVLAGSAYKENSQNDAATEVAEGNARVYGGNNEQEKSKHKAGSGGEHKSSGFSSMFNKITYPKGSAPQLKAKKTG